MPLKIDDLFEILTDGSHSIEIITLSKLELSWPLAQTATHFSMNLQRYANAKGQLDFLIENCTIDVGDVNQNAHILLILHLTMKETVTTDAVDVLDSIMLLINFESCKERIEKLFLSYDGALLQSVEISGTIQTSSCQDLRKLSSLWKVEAENVYCSNLVFKCAENQCARQCSSLFFVLNNLPTISLDEIKYQFNKHTFTKDSLAHLNEYFSQLEQKDNQRKQIYLENINFLLQRHDSRNNFMHTQQQFLSALEDLGLQFRTISISVHTDRSNWSYVKIILSGKEVILKFINEVTVNFPLKSTKESRVVCVEVHPIPEEVIKRICAWQSEGEIHVSPVVFVDQIDNSPFLEPVSIKLPYSSSKTDVSGSNLKTIGYSKMSYTERDWYLVPENKIQRSLLSLKYESKEFSPFLAISSLTEKVLKLFKVSDLSDAYFPNCVYVTVLTLDHKPRNAVFNCVKIQNEEDWKTLKVGTQIEYAKVGLMGRDDIIFAQLDPNLCLDPFFHRDRANDRLQFYCPEHISNRQECILKKVSVDEDPRGFVVFSYSCGGIETPLTSICYSVNNLKNANFANNRGNQLRYVNDDLEGDQQEHILGTEAQANPIIDPGKNWVVGPPMHPEELVGPEIDPTVLIGPVLDQDGFVRPEEVTIFSDFQN